MDHAEDRRGHIVKARNASPGPFYRCPVCRAEVFLRSGKYNARHFAHKAGQGRAECEYFHPSDYVRGPWPSPSRYDDELDGPPVPPLALGIELDPVPESRLKGLRNWQLALTVPKAPDTHGSISIDCGTGAPRQISLTKLSLGPQTYPASVDATDFGQVWMSPEVRRRYRTAIEQRIPGLDRDIVNIFTHTKQKQKPLANSLTWGGSYYLIWRTALAVEIPKSLLSSPLANRGEWACSFVALPEEDDEGVRLWIEEVSRLTITRSRRSWAVIHPPVLDIDSLGRLSVSSSTGLLFASYSPHDQATEETAITCSVGNSTASIPSKSGNHFFEVRHDSRSDAPLALSWDGFALPEFAKAEPPDAIDSFGAAFTFRSRFGAERSNALLHQVQFDQLLSRVRRLELDVVVISLPPGANGLFKCRKELGWDWQTTTLSSGSDISGVIPQINASLQDASLDVCFDFGAFGACYLPRASREVRGLDMRIPQSVRDKIVWFCITAKSYPASEKRPFGTLDDEALLRHLARVATPMSLIAHRRHLDRLIETATSGRRSA